MTTDYRRARRRKVGSTIDVTDTMTTEVIGRLGNLSETGMLILTNVPLCNDALYQFRFSLPDDRGGGRPIEVGAHELWADDSSAGGQVWTGFRFIDMSAEDVGYIRAWVDAPGSEYV